MVFSRKRGHFLYHFFLNIKLAIHELLNNKKIKICLVKYLYGINSGENDTKLDQFNVVKSKTICFIYVLLQSKSERIKMSFSLSHFLSKITPQNMYDDHRHWIVYPL